MPLSIERALLLVRELGPDGGPLCPDGWTCFAQDGGWYEVETPEGARVLCYRENSNGTHGLFALFGDVETLALIESMSSLAKPARWVWRHRNDAGVKPYVRRWRTLRGSGQERVDGELVPWSGVRTVVPVGAVLPDWTLSPLPWNLDVTGAITLLPGDVVMRVEAVSGPDTMALAAEMAGAASPEQFEDEPDPGT